MLILSLGTYLVLSKSKQNINFCTTFIFSRDKWTFKKFSLAGSQPELILYEPNKTA